jgi:hypothetical protein
MHLRQGAEPIGSSAKAFKIFIAAEYHCWGKLIRAVGVKAEIGTSKPMSLVIQPVSPHIGRK